MSLPQACGEFGNRFRTIKVNKSHNQATVLCNCHSDLAFLQISVITDVYSKSEQLSGESKRLIF